MPFNAITLRRASQKAHGTEVKSQRGSMEHLVGRNGHINASDRQDLLKQIGHLANLVQAGEVMTPTDEQVVSASETRQQVLAAYRSNDPRQWQELGSTIGTELYETANREGFMRRVLMRCEVEQGALPRIPINFKSTYAFEAASASQIQPTFARNKYVMPPEFYINTHLWVEEREIFQSTADILEQKLLEAQEATMVKEDKVWKRLTDRMVGLSNAPLTIVGGLTPQNLGLMRSQLQAWNLPTDTLIFASDVLQDITTSTAFGAFYDPVSQFEIVQTGYIGKLLGMTLLTDAYRVPQQHVLQAGDIYLITRPEYHGGFTDRGPVSANEVNAATTGHGVAARGWFLWELLSMVVSNSRSISYAKRVS